MKLPGELHTAAASVVMLLLMVTGCATGYSLHHKDGAEILYNIDESGTRQIVYVVDRDGRLQIHNENDPLVKRIYKGYRTGSGVQGYTDWPSTEVDTPHQQVLAAKLIQMGRLQVAEKRNETDPIFVTVRTSEVDTKDNTEQARRRTREMAMEELSRDNIITNIPKSADVDIFFKSYVRETAAVNIQTHKLVYVSAFYFEALVRSNYLPEKSHTICEIGHLMDRRMVISRTVQRVRSVIKEKIGPNIPKDRARFLPSHSRGV